MIYLFYLEPKRRDRWFPGDANVRMIFRKIFPRPPKFSGQAAIIQKLSKGLDYLDVDYVINDWRSLRRGNIKTAVLIGKYCALDKFKSVELIYGSAVHDHPIIDPLLTLNNPNIKRILVPGDWLADEFRKYYNNIPINSWPSGIDTEFWKEGSVSKHIDFVIYKKIRWEDSVLQTLFQHVIEFLASKGISYAILEYGSYTKEQMLKLCQNSRFGIFICEHETQGFGYQQMLSCDLPLLAYAGTKYWMDPNYFPNKVRITSARATPYWSSSCGELFFDQASFEEKLGVLFSNNYSPREFVEKNLSLIESAKLFLELYEK